MSIVNKIAMSKGVGKVLDSKVGKGMVKVGNAVIKGAKAPGNLVAGALKKEAAMSKAKDEKYRREGEAYRKNIDNYNTSSYYQSKK